MRQTETTKCKKRIARITIVIIEGQVEMPNPNPVQRQIVLKKNSIRAKRNVDFAAKDAT